jgi:hypothetical protein
MKISSIIRRLLERRSQRMTLEQGPAPPADPIDHPEIRRMSLRELADLPFERNCARR